VKTSLRAMLAESNTATATIALLVLWSLDGLFQALWAPIFRVASYLFTAVAILDIPYFSPNLNFMDRGMLTLAVAYLYSAIVSFLAAWLLSRWVFGVGPFRHLFVYRRKLMGRFDV
jgi:hypothetical protein